MSRRRTARNSHKRNTLTSAVTNCIRGGQATSDTLVTIHRELTSRRSERLGKINDFVARTAFHIPAKDYGEALRLDNRHLFQILRLRASQSTIVEENYLRLATQYIAHNVERVNAWIKFNSEVSRQTFEPDAAEKIQSSLLSLAGVDRQSISALKLYAGLHSYSDDIIKEYLNSNSTSDWLRTRLLYPIIYYSINLPNPALLEQTLEHMFPSEGSGPAERIVTRLVLEPHRNDVGNLATRCYVGLLSHPYDTLEYITFDLERRLATGEPLSSEYLEQFTKLAELFPSHRVAPLVRIADGSLLPFRERPTSFFGFDYCEDDPRFIVLACALDATVTARPELPDSAPLLSFLADMRWSRYPTRAQFEELNTFCQRFHMLNSGMLVDFICRSLFLFSREPHRQELTALWRGSVIIGCCTPVTASGPSAYQALVSGRFPTGTTESQVVSEVSRILNVKAEARTDRIWINAANWALAALQQAGRIVEWAKEGRAKFPIWVTPRYLSGLDWNWLARVIESAGVLPMRGDPNGIYVLFMRQLEEFRRESVPLRLAIEPIARTDPDRFGEWLMDEYGPVSTAIVRFFLTADTILKLRLADNYTAAATYRLVLLENCVRAFDFSENFFDEADLRQEQVALTAMLSRMSVGARQFEINWTALKGDARLRNGDAYAAYETMRGAMSESLTLANAKRASSYPFSNGASGEFEGRNRDWPLLMVIAGIIDTFLTHPSAGIESILSVRIRHDALRREFAAAINDVRSNSLAGVRSSVSDKLPNSFEHGIYREIQKWLDLHMHTLRKDKPEAFFNLIPTKSEMSELVQEAINLATLEDVIDLVFGWIKPRLEKQLKIARTSLSTDLRQTLEKRVAETQSGLTRSNATEDEITRVSHALSTALTIRANELEEWFKIPDEDRDKSLCVSEILAAVQQRFTNELGSGRLRLDVLPVDLANRVVQPAQIRHLYDLLSELIQNALKHSGIDVCSMRFSLLRSDGAWGVIVSNNRLDCTPVQLVLSGHPYETLHDSLFREGNTGLNKISYLAASMVSKVVEARAIGRNRWFHIVLPIDVFGSMEGSRA